MIAFDRDEMRFNYRVVGIALQRGCVLIHRTYNEAFWSLPGGRVEFLEPSQEALKREMQEEIGVDVRVDRLVWVVENFFQYSGWHYHELSLYFLMLFPSKPHFNPDIETFAGNDKEQSLIFRWQKLDRLDEIELYPAFLKRSLQLIPKDTQHIVYVEK